MASQCIHLFLQSSAAIRTEALLWAPPLKLPGSAHACHVQMSGSPAYIMQLDGHQEDMISTEHLTYATLRNLEGMKLNSEKIMSTQHFSKLEQLDPDSFSWPLLPSAWLKELVSSQPTQPIQMSHGWQSAHTGIKNQTMPYEVI